MPSGDFALDTRLELARRAERSLDVQYYQIDNDETGRYLLRTLRDAAQRGVRVRLLMDDLYTSGEDELLLGLAATPNVELRLFNPFPAGRGSLLQALRGLAVRLQPRQPAHAQQAVHRRRRDGGGRRAQHRRRVLHADGRRELHRPRHLRRRRAAAAAGRACSTSTGTASTCCRSQAVVAPTLPREELQRRFEELTGPATTPPPRAAGAQRPARLQPDRRRPRRRQARPDLDHAPRPMPIRPTA